MKKITLAVLFLLVTTLVFSQDTLTIELLTDAYPEETAWGVFDSSGTLIAQNGTLTSETLVTTNISASATECYQFVIVDSYGDGIGGYNGSPQGYLNILYNGVNIGGFTTAQSNFGSRLDIFGLGAGCPNIDASMVRLNNVPFTAVGNTDVSCLVQNTGLSNLTSFDINYQVDSGVIVTQNVTGINMAIGDMNEYTFTTPWAVNTPGEYNLRTWVSNVNATTDENAANDSKEKDINVASQSVANLPLFESFTSSTCAPCAPFNTNVFNPFMAQHPNDMTVVKYQMSWPAPGDPYYTAEGGVRRSFYGVNSVPSLIGGGKDVNTNSGAVSSSFNNEVSKDAFFNVSAKHAFRSGDNSVDVELDIDPYISGDFTVHAVVIEQLTTQNVGNNGETQFENVMMKMVPNANGTIVSFVDGVHQNINLSASMVGTNVEEMSDLEVIVFVQHADSKIIMQSFKSVLDNTASTNNFVFENIMVYPNPAKDVVNVKTDRKILISLTDILGKTVLTDVVVARKSLDVSNLDSGLYIVTISDGKYTQTEKLIIK